MIAYFRVLLHYCLSGARSHPHTCKTSRFSSGKEAEPTWTNPSGFCLEQFSRSPRESTVHLSKLYGKVGGMRSTSSVNWSCKYWPLYTDSLHGPKDQKSTRSSRVDTGAGSANLGSSNLGDCPTQARAQDWKRHDLEGFPYTLARKESTAWRLHGL